MMPATRATPSTSPFLASPLRTTSSVLACMITRPSATATRALTGLADTSTMRASPREPRCESLFVLRATRLPRRGEGGLRGQQSAGCCRDIVLPHQALTDQEGRDVRSGEPRQVGRREYAAFADNDAIGGHEPGQTLAGRKRGRKSFQIAIIDADEL